MLLIQHRINTIEALRKVPTAYGIEVDIRYHNDTLILHHDAFTIGESFEDFLKIYNHKFIILNTKSEGMEEKIIELMEKFKIEDYFFLDLSLPFLVKYSSKGVNRIAVRFSEFEPIEFIAKFVKRVSWVWIDCFTKLPLDESNYKFLRENFKLCIVSPELQGFDKSKINEFKLLLKPFKIDAVCTKHPELWL